MSIHEWPCAAIVLSYCSNTFVDQMSPIFIEHVRIYVDGCRLKCINKHIGYVVCKYDVPEKEAYKQNINIKMNLGQ